MKSKTLLLAALVGVAAASAQAGVSWNIAIGLPLPVFVSQPVVCTPPPVVYAAPCPPPAPPVVVESVLACPSPDYVWVGGCWTYRPTGYVWVHGGWSHRPMHYEYRRNYDGHRW